MEKTNTFMTVVDVMEYLEVSESKAYRIIRLLNKELKDKGYIVIPGRISCKFRSNGVSISFETVCICCSTGVSVWNFGVWFVVV